ncbi:HAD family hydrolase [Saccharopolyspora rosea]|uniref:HAD family hydrolase n=1 Tax=Saccharopolyspora rosea TaxID=524884 RepID=A0ABW3FQM3_9PSEU|nr:HAD-IA family hydrolase [Saccharopolyspora rosea]
MTAISIDPDRHRAVLFDMDGVVTDTARVHAAAWKRLFDRYFAERPASAGEDHRPFSEDDYVRHVDGKPRVAGVVDLLRSRGMHLPLGTAGDEPGRKTAHGLAALKDVHFREALDSAGVEVFDDARALLAELRGRGVRTAVFSASRHCAEILARADLLGLFDARVDGQVADALGLAGKPDPAMLLEAARRAGAGPAASVVVEDSRAGVTAGRRGGFSLVIGLDRRGCPAPLTEAGADVVVSALDEVAVAAPGRSR